MTLYGSLVPATRRRIIKSCRLLLKKVGTTAVRIVDSVEYPGGKLTELERGTTTTEEIRVVTAALTFKSRKCQIAGANEVDNSLWVQTGRVHQ
jgi:hypothetical protein